MTVGEALAAARTRGVARLDAQLLLAHRLRRPRAWLLAHGDAALAAADAAAWEADLRRRAGGEPVAYIVGAKEFFGLELAVSSAVLVPRPETELLVDWALEVGGDDVVDLGTGSGAIALAFKSRRPAARVVGIDASAAALAVAAANATRLGLDVAWAGGDWWQAIGDRRFDLALSNPPYVADGDPHLRALAHEPIDALASGADGLGALRLVVAGAPRHLRPGGRLIVEHGHDQRDAVQALLAAAGFSAIETRHDIAGLPRCSGGTMSR